MHGKYDQAIASYDRALGFRLGWKEAEENKALALARKAKIEASGQDRDEEQTTEEKADDIVFDQKGDDQKRKPVELAAGEMSDEQLRATWLRQVQTTPGDFLRAKFAYQAAVLIALALALSCYARLRAFVPAVFARFRPVCLAPLNPPPRSR
jgi:Ca-activated chloride channel homolog